MRLARFAQKRRREGSGWSTHSAGGPCGPTWPAPHAPAFRETTSNRGVALGFWASRTDERNNSAMPLTVFNEDYSPAQASLLNGHCVPHHSFSISIVTPALIGAGLLQPVHHQHFNRGVHRFQPQALILHNGEYVVLR